MSSFAEVVLARAEADPGGEVIRLAGQPGWSASELVSRAFELARDLSSRVSTGDVVATSVENGPEAVALTTAVSLLGAVELPIPATEPTLARHLVDATGCTVVVSSVEDLGSARGRLPRHVPSPGDPAVIMATSGTTGRPKGAVLPNGSGLGQAHRVQRAMRYSRTDVLYNFFPWQHINARHSAFLPAMLGGARLVVDRRFSASRFWDVARAEGVTAFNFMGAVCVMLLRRPERDNDRVHQVRRAYGGPAPAWLVEQMRERFGVRLLQAYACTELGDVSVTDAAELRPGAAGRPVPEYDVRTTETGELLVRPREPHLTFTEYVADPGATESAWEDGWFRTGDRVRLSGGWLYFEGRSADVIRRRGINIAPSTVEEAAESLPGVTASAAVAVPSDLTEDEVLLVVVPAPGATLDPAAVRAHCAARLPRHSVPRYVSVEKDLPRNGSLKVRRSVLRDRGLPASAWDAEAG